MSVEDFIEDVRLVWHNACLYNPPTQPVSLAARRMEAEMERKLSELTELPAASSSAAGAGRSSQPNLARVPSVDGLVTSVSVYKCRTILKSMISNQNSLYFRVPVDPLALNIPQYPDIVKQPMDVRARLPRADALPPG